MSNYLSWSGGKDSTACVILAHENKIPIDRILFSEVMFDKKNNISGELPEHIDFVKNVAIPKFTEWGYKTEILHAKKDYLDSFYAEIVKGPRKGQLHGFPLGGRCIINRDTKLKPIHDFYKSCSDVTQIVGIAIDEPERLKRLEGTNKISLLAEYGLTEEDAKNLCIEYGLLSPIYQNSNRGGCWFCPNQKIAELSKLRQQRPEYWNALKELSKTPNLCSYGFKYGKTVEEVEERLNIYDANKEAESLQIRLF